MIPGLGGVPVFSSAATTPAEKTSALGLQQETRQYITPQFRPKDGDTLAIYYGDTPHPPVAKIQAQAIGGGRAERVGKNTWGGQGELPNEKSAYIIIQQHCRVADWNTYCRMEDGGGKGGG